MRHLLTGFFLLGLGLFSTFLLASTLQHLGQLEHARVASAVPKNDVVVDSGSFLPPISTGRHPPSNEIKVSSAPVERVGRSRASRHLAGEAAAAYLVDKDLDYGDQPRQKLDLYTPARPRSDGKVVVYFYGGGFNQGSKALNESVGKLLASEGIVTVIPDYRLYPEVRFPAFVEDAALAVRWAADRFGADKLILMGHSAGAYIALMLAANSPYLEAAGVDRERLRAAIGLAGPYDLLPFQNAPYLVDVFRGAKDPNIYPTAFTSGKLPAVMLVHGTADAIVEPGNAVRYAALWRRARGEAALRVYAGASHLDVLIEASDQRFPVYDDVLAFIDRH